MMEEDRTPDFLDCIADYDTTVSQEGFQSGLVHGMSEGVREGFLLGLQRGSKLAADVGYYRGFAQHILYVMTHSTPLILKSLCGGDRESQRVLKVCQKLCDMTQLVDWTDMGDTKIATIEAKFRQLHSLLQLEILQAQVSSLSF